MKKVKAKLFGDELVSSVRSFMEDIIIFNSNLKAKEIPSLHRLFPRDIIAMFRLWYNESQGEETHIIMDEGEFIICFERLLSKKKKYECKESKSAYALSQGEYKYQFPSLRLTKQGLKIYINLLSD
jgi:hypothetical protein